MMRSVTMCLVLLVALVSVAGAMTEVFTVPATGEVVTSSALISGQEYRIMATGTYTFGPSMLADADWYWMPGYTEWNETKVYYSHTDLLDLMVDAQRVDWWGRDAQGVYAPHTFSPSHTYCLPSVFGTGSPMSFQIEDTNYADNSGCLTVEIIPIPEPTTLVLLAASAFLARARRVRR